MFKLITWIIWLLLLLWICYFSCPQIVLTPQFAFVSGFILQALYALFYVDKWDLDFCNTTLITLFGGSAVYVGLSVFIQYFFQSRMGYTNRKDKYENFLLSSRLVNRKNNIGQPLFIERWKLLFLLLFQLITLGWMMSYFSSLGGSTLQKGMSVYRMIATTSPEKLHTPQLLDWFRHFSEASGFLSSYLFIHSIIVGYNSNRMLLIMNYGISLLLSVVYGYRGDLLLLIVAAIVQAYFLYGHIKGWKRLQLKTILYVIGIAMLILSLLPIMQEWIGRGASTINSADYIAMYLSAELKNLDNFARRGRFGANFENCSTIANAISLFGELFGIDSWVHAGKGIPFGYINGYQLGNVATIFQPMLADGGITAVVIYMMFMSICCQFFYLHAQSYKVQNIDLGILLYSFAFFTVFLSFFSNRFFSQMFSSYPIKLIISWLILRFFYTKIHFSKKHYRFMYFHL